MLPAHHHSDSVENQFGRKHDTISYAKKPCNELGVQEIMVKGHTVHLENNFWRQIFVFY